MAEDVSVLLREKRTDKLMRSFRQLTLSLCTVSAKLRLCKQGKGDTKVASRARSPRRRKGGCGRCRRQIDSPPSIIAPCARRTGGAGGQGL